MSVGPCVRKLWPRKAQILWIFVRKRDKEAIQKLFLPPKHPLNLLTLLLAHSRHWYLQFGTPIMHVGACVLQKLRKLGGRGQNFGFYTKIAQKGLLSTHRGGKWCPNGVLMTSTCSGHGYYKMASKLGLKSKPF